MIRFRCIPMETASAIRFRQTGHDDAGNPLHHKIADHPLPADTALQNPRSARPSCAAPIISAGRTRLLDAKPDLSSCRAL
jgi:hypothetical protein